jgi:hypothetical protein
MVELTKTGKVSVKKTLTKTMGISKSQKKPAIKLVPSSENKIEVINKGKEWNVAELKKRMTKANALAEKNKGKNIFKPQIKKYIHLNKFEGNIIKRARELGAIKNKAQTEADAKLKAKVEAEAKPEPEEDNKLYNIVESIISPTRNKISYDINKKDTTPIKYKNILKKYNLPLDTTKKELTEIIKKIDFDIYEKFKADNKKNEEYRKNIKKKQEAEAEAKAEMERLKEKDTEIVKFSDVEDPENNSKTKNYSWTSKKGNAIDAALKYKDIKYYFENSYKFMDKQDIPTIDELKNVSYILYSLTPKFKVMKTTYRETSALTAAEKLQSIINNITDEEYKIIMKIAYNDAINNNNKFLYKACNLYKKKLENDAQLEQKKRDEREEAYNNRTPEEIKKDKEFRKKLSENAYTRETSKNEMILL